MNSHYDFMDEEENDHNPWLMVAVFAALLIGACFMGALIFHFIKPLFSHA